MDLKTFGTLINAFANVATIAGVYLVWKKEEKNKNDITDLKVLANQLSLQNDLQRERLDLQLMELKAEVNAVWTSVLMDTHGASNTINLRIPNEGGVVTIYEVKYETKHVSFRTIKEPMFRVKPKTELVFEGAADGTSYIYDYTFKITFSYHDRYGYSYTAIITRNTGMERPKLELRESPLKRNFTYSV
jgi:hypothetical protein